MAPLRVRLTTTKKTAALPASSPTNRVGSPAVSAANAGPTSSPAGLPRIKLLSTATAGPKDATGSGTGNAPKRGKKTENIASASTASASSSAGRKRTHAEVVASEPTAASEPKKVLKLSLHSSRPLESHPDPKPAVAALEKPKIKLKNLKVAASKATARSNGPRSLPNLKIKHLGKPPERPPGEGYDSEDDGAEADPAIETGFIFRMAPGPDCDYLAQAVAERRIGHPDVRLRARVSFKFFDRDGRRVMVSIRGVSYAAAMVDLPCVVEACKSWDRKSVYKSADVCQMLLVLGPVESEDAARSFPLPKEIDPRSWAYMDGITPPMHRVRTRRFRPRLNFGTLDDLDAEVDALLEADRLAKEGGGSSEYRLVVIGGESETEPETGVPDSDGGRDGEPETETEAEAPTEATGDDQGFDDATLAEMQAALMEDDDERENTVAELLSTDPDPADDTAADDDDDDAGDDNDEEDEEEGGGELDEMTAARQNELLELREQISELVADLRTKRAQLATQENRLLRQRLQSAIERLVQDVAVRRREYFALGGSEDEVEGGDEDEG